MPFAHLHVHTYYSILDGASRIKDLLKVAEKNGQSALALTDHGNMYGAKELLDTAKKMNSPVKPIIGCEVYLAKFGNRLERHGKQDQSSYHLILLAKNMVGYHNLTKMVSLGFIEGMHYKPRIDHELLEKYHEGIICSSACLGGEIPQAIMEKDIDKAEKLIEWYKSIFGDDYYLEVQRHETDVPGAEVETFWKQQEVNAVIFRLAEKHGVKVIATNDVHFVNKDDGQAHDRLICISTNSDFDDPNRLRYTQQEYLKSTEEMEAIFADHPEVISNTMEIVNKVEVIDLNHDPILPVFPLPEGFTDSNEYLKYLTYEGAHVRYGENIEPTTQERIDFELATIKKMGFPDYFLIVRDFIKAARDMGVWVGPGRGSAAGSVVAYCLTITNIDPIKYDLLFERFLNPERISMPDIDIDFDDEGRYRVFKYVEEKYGRTHVSHVVTFGTMATKSVIRDVGRIEKLPLQETDRLAKLVPKKITIEEEKEVEDEKDPTKKVIKKVPKEVDPTIHLCLEKVQEFKDAMASGNELLSDTLRFADKLEGTVRNTGVHACATIIGRDDLTNYIPICTATDKETGKDILVSQFEGSLIESAGMLKMDFLGLKTLSILKDCVENIHHSKGIDLDINNIPIDDKETYELFSRGDTIGIFQFESEGMQKWLRDLHPTVFSDLIAMNALYRPGPMDYIPDFVARKKGEKKIEYDLPEMEEYLKDTYGVTVYQEQVMLLSQKLAGFTKGQADKLRKAMGKKQISVMADMKEKFFHGGLDHGHPEAILNKIWKDWQAFAQYAFNKSHATCYAWVGYQTGYLKAHYPAEYMAAVMSNSLNNIEEITKFMDDCKHGGVQVLGPDVNEGYTKFTVNHDGNIRFGMAGIKGIGAAAVDSIIEVREKDGPFKDVFDFVERVNTQMVNKKGMESLIYSGAFDCFPEVNRGTFSLDAGKGESFLDMILRYGGRFQKDSDSMSNNLFGGGDAIQTARPAIPVSTEELNQMELLKKEKELVGMYLSAHPLDKFRFEMNQFSDTTIAQMSDMADRALKEDEFMNKECLIAGLVTNVEVRMSKTNRPWCRLTVEDFSGSTTFALFGKDYETFLAFAQPHLAILLKVVITPKYPFLSQEERDKQKQQNGGRYERPKPIGCEPKIRAITLLANCKDSYVKEMVISLPVTRINPSFRKDLKHAIRSNKGNAALIFNMLDYENKLSVEFISRKYKISPDEGLINFLDENGLKYKLIKAISL